MTQTHTQTQTTTQTHTVTHSLTRTRTHRIMQKFRITVCVCVQVWSYVSLCHCVYVLFKFIILPPPPSLSVCSSMFYLILSHVMSSLFSINLSLCQNPQSSLHPFLLMSLLSQPHHQSTQIPSSSVQTDLIP